jgi:PAS domain S-box-containing protein
MKKQLKIKKQLTQVGKKVREASDEWAMTFNSISDLVSIQDKDFRIIKVNKAFADTFGMGAEELIGKKCHEIIHGREEPWPNCPHTQALQSGKPVTGEFWEPRLGRYLQVSASPIVNKKNETIGTVHIAKDITERKRAEEEIRQLLQSVKEQREELRALGARLSEVEEDERRRLSGELHDRVGQNLTALGINLNILRNQLPAEAAGKAGKALEDSLRLVVKTVEDIRNVMAELRPPLLDEYGLLPALRWYGKQFSERTGLNTVVEGGETMPRLQPEIEIALFRITQEALTNVAKHGRASRVTVTLEEVDERTILTIADNGAGFDPKASQPTGAGTKWGLILIRERAEVVGGQVRIDSGPGKGTRIVVEVKG